MPHPWEEAAHPRDHRSGEFAHEAVDAAKKVLTHESVSPRVLVVGDHIRVKRHTAPGLTGIYAARPSEKGGHHAAVTRVEPHTVHFRDSAGREGDVPIGTNTRVHRLAVEPHEDAPISPQPPHPVSPSQPDTDPLAGVTGFVPAPGQTHAHCRTDGAELPLSKFPTVGGGRRGTECREHRDARRAALKAETGPQPLAWKRNAAGRGLVSADGRYYIEPGAGSSNLYERASKEDYESGARDVQHLIGDPPFEYGRYLSSDTQVVLRQHAQEHASGGSAEPEAAAGILGVQPVGARVRVEHDGHPNDGQTVTVQSKTGATGGTGGGGTVTTDAGVLSRHTRVVPAEAEETAPQEPQEVQDARDVIMRFETTRMGRTPSRPERDAYRQAVRTVSDHEIRSGAVSSGPPAAGPTPEEEIAAAESRVRAAEGARNEHATEEQRLNAIINKRGSAGVGSGVTASLRRASQDRRAAEDEHRAAVREVADLRRKHGIEAPRDMSDAAVTSRVDAALRDSENTHYDAASLDPSDLEEALQEDSGRRYITYKPPSGYEMSLHRDDAQAIVRMLRRGSRGTKDLGVTSGATGGPGVGTFSGGTMTVPVFGSRKKRSVRLVEAAHRRGAFSPVVGRKTLVDVAAAATLGVETPAPPVEETKAAPAAVVHEPPPVTGTKADAVLGGVAVPGQKPRVLYTSGTGDDRLDWAGSPDSPADLDHKVGGLTIDIDDDLVLALVAVTGIVDEVADFAEPGSFDETLRLRIPKGVWSHDWDTWVSRTEAIEELMPGDARLPKETRTGDAWPRTAGGLLVATRFNVDTQPGREGLSNVKFFDEGPLGPQTEWSIGYNVRPGRAFKTRDGVRHIQSWDVFEYGPVLFGAASLSGTLAIAGTKASAMRRERRLRL